MKTSILDCVKKSFSEMMMDFNRQKAAVLIQGLGATAPFPLELTSMDFGFYVHVWCALNYTNLIIEKFQGKFSFLQTIRRFKLLVASWGIFWGIYIGYRMIAFRSISGETRLDHFILNVVICIVFTVYLFPLLAVLTKDASYKRELFVLGSALLGALLLS